MNLQHKNRVGTKLVRSTSLVLLLVMATGIAWNVYTQSNRARLELLEQARVLSAQVLALRQVTAENQYKINYNSEGHFEFKHLNPAAFVRQVGGVFNTRTDYKIRQVSLSPRIPENKPDSYERAQLVAFAGKDKQEESWGEAVVDGKKYFRYMVPLYINSSCLPCHGEPKGELDVSGNPKEGYKPGDLAGALTISIPMATKEASLNQSLWQAVFFTVLAIAFSGAIIALHTDRFVTKPIGCLTKYSQELGEGNWHAKPCDFKAYGEVEELHQRFAEMAHHLHELYSALEQKVDERTKELGAANYELAKVSQYKTEFLANMSHELRTPLTAIMVFTEDLLTKNKGQLTADQEQYLKSIKDSGNQLLELINDLLDLSKIESGKMSLNLTEVRVGDIVRDVRTVLQPLADQKRIRIESSITDFDVVIADAGKVRQVVRNLLGNAIKFTEDGKEIEITVYNTGLPVEGTVLSIKDSGPGIPQEEQQLIFDSFYQVNRGLSREFRGTGLGLALVKKIVDLHLGRVELTSREGVGTTFNVFWPAFPSFDEGVE